MTDDHGYEQAAYRVAAKALRDEAERLRTEKPSGVMWGLWAQRMDSAAEWLEAQ